jgi:hypothetical protein
LAAEKRRRRFKITNPAYIPLACVRGFGIGGNFNKMVFLVVDDAFGASAAAPDQGRKYGVRKPSTPPRISAVSILWTL